jgi:N-acetylmuramoyl-L-alanine amidase
MRPINRTFALLRWTIAVLSLVVPALAAVAEEAPPPEKGDIPVMFDARVVGDHTRGRFIADVSRNLEMAVFTLADPYRIVIDMPEIRFALPRSEARIGRGLVADFRYGLISAGKSRIVIDVTVPVLIDKSFVVAPTDGQPARLVVDVVPTTREKFLEANRAYRQQQIASAEEKADRSLSAVARTGDRPMVVIDPGHGGIDSGARGPAGNIEKDITLSFAKVLGEKLRETGLYDVAFTRTTDVFVPLGERVAIARQNDADLFMSIHANSFRGRSVRGATIYTVSEEASDKMAEEMAELENQSDILAGIDIDGEDSDEVKDILLDLTKRETRNFGVTFARNLVKEMGKATTMFKIPHQQASFKVLEAPDVPSALIELGYLSNKGDEKLLVSEEWQAKAADSVTEAVAAYFRTRVADGRGQ